MREGEKREMEGRKSEMLISSEKDEEEEEENF